MFFGLLFVYISIDMCQLHHIIFPLKYLKLGFITEKILLLGTIFNLYRYNGIKNVLISRFLFLLIICIGVSTAYSRGRAFEVAQMDFFRYFAGFAAICLFVTNFKQVQLLMNLFVFAGLACSIYVILHGGKGLGTFTDENDIASLLVMLLPIPYFISTITKSFMYKSVLQIAFLITLAGIAATLSRGGMIGTLPTLFLIWSRSKQKIVTTLIIIAALFAVTIWGPANLLTEFSSISNRDDRTANSRLYFWNLSIQMLIKKPIIGVGPNSWGHAIWAGVVPLEKNVDNITPHSLYFQLISEQGVVGIIIFITFCFFLISNFKKINRLIKYQKNFLAEKCDRELECYGTYVNALGIGIIGFAFCSVFISTLYYPHFYYYAFLLTAIENILQKAYLEKESLDVMSTI
jgi:O-antigen ligase